MAGFQGTHEETFQVKVGQPGQRTKLMSVQPGQTALDVVRAAGFDPGAKDIRIGADVVRPTHVVQPGDMLMVSPRVDAGVA